MKKLLKELGVEIKLLRKLKEEQAPPGEYFFAFTKNDVEEGMARIGITDKSLIIPDRRVGMGLFGTAKGIKEFWDFQDSQFKRIQEQISPLAYFRYEYGNHEGEYNSDGTAWTITKEVYPDFDFDDPHNAKVIAAIRKEWMALNGGW